MQEPVAQAAHNIVAGDAERNAQQDSYEVQLYPVDLQQCADGDDGPHGKRRDAEQGDEAGVHEQQYDGAGGQRCGERHAEAGGGEHSLKIGRDLRHLRQNERGQQREAEAGDGHEQARAEPCNGRKMVVQAQRIYERGKEHGDVRHGGHQDAAEEVVLFHGFARRADGVLAVAQPQLGKPLDRKAEGARLLRSLRLLILGLLGLLGLLRAGADAALRQRAAAACAKSCHNG